MAINSKKFKKENLILLGLVALACSLAFALRIPAFNFPLDYDVGGHYFYGMQVVRRGFYSVLWEMKPAGLLLIFASIYKFFGGSILMIYIVGSLFWVFSTFLFYKLADLLFGSRIGVLSALIFALFASNRAVQGEMINTETFLMLPTLLGIYLFFKTGGRKDGRFFVFSGLSFGIAFTIKQVAAFDMLALLTYSLIFLYDLRKNLDAVVKSHLILAFSFLLPTSIFALYFLLTGRFNDFSYWQFAKTFQNHTTYHLSGAGFENFFLNFGPIFKKTYPLWLIFFGGVANTVFFFRSPKRIFLLIWIFCILLGMYFMWWFFPHHFIQLAPPVSALAGLFLGDLLAFGEKNLNKFWWNVKNGSVVVGLFLGLFLFLKADSTYFVSFLQRLGGKIGEKEHLAAVGFDVGPDGWLPFYATADYLKKSKGTIFLWESVPTIYALTEKQPISWFVYKYPLVSDDLRTRTYQGWFANVEESRKKMMEDLLRGFPEYILIRVEPEKIFDEMLPFPEFSDFIANNYVFDRQIGNILLYKKNKEKPTLTGGRTVLPEMIKRFAAITGVEKDEGQTTLTFEPMVNPHGILRSFKVTYPQPMEIGFEPISVEFLGPERRDWVGVADLHLRVSGVQRPVSFLRVKMDDITWNNRSYGVNRTLKVIQKGGIFDLYFEPVPGGQGKTFEVYFIYEDGRLSRQDITL